MRKRRRVCITSYVALGDKCHRYINNSEVHQNAVSQLLQKGIKRKCHLHALGGLQILVLTLPEPSGQGRDATAEAYFAFAMIVALASDSALTDASIRRAWNAEKRVSETIRKIRNGGFDANAQTLARSAPFGCVALL
jgi:hypothetical protein